MGLKEPPVVNWDWDEVGMLLLAVEMKGKHPQGWD